MTNRSKPLITSHTSHGHTQHEVHKVRPSLMGIPHLIAFLKPYVTEELLAGRNVVIDGPGFAHHVYYVCLGSRSNARNPFEAAPSYEELGNAAIRWLDELRESNVAM